MGGVIRRRRFTAGFPSAGGRQYARVSAAGRLTESQTVARHAARSLLHL